MDVGKSTFLSGEKFDFLAENQEAIRRVSRPPGVHDSEWKLDEAKKHYRKIVRYRKKVAKAENRKGGFADFTLDQSDKNLSKEVMIELWHALDEEGRANLNPRRLPDSVDVKFHPTNTLGALPEKMLDQIDSYMKSNPRCGEDFRSTLFWKG
jgi:hypothetical protein